MWVFGRMRKTCDPHSFGLPLLGPGHLNQQRLAAGEQPAITVVDRDPGQMLAPVVLDRPGGHDRGLADGHRPQSLDPLAGEDVEATLWKLANRPDRRTIERCPDHLGRDRLSLLCERRIRCPSRSEEISLRAGPAHEKPKAVARVTVWPAGEAARVEVPEFVVDQAVTRFLRLGEPGRRGDLKLELFGFRLEHERFAIA